MAARRFKRARISRKLCHRRMDRHDASDRSRRPVPMSARCARGRCAPATAPIASPAKKIFITYGEHDLTENIIHFVLARLSDAPPGTRGISLVSGAEIPATNADGTPGARKRRARPLDRGYKLGVHSFADLHLMVFGDHGGSHGLHHRPRECRHGGHVHHDESRPACRRFAGRPASPNAPRNRPSAYARERKQGRTSGMPATESAPGSSTPIRTSSACSLTMRALTQAARSICYATAMALDRAERGTDKAAREAAHARASLLTPLAKAFSSDIGIEVASLGVQVHGAHGLYRRNRRRTVLPRRPHRPDL